MFDTYRLVSLVGTPLSLLLVFLLGLLWGWVLGLYLDFLDWRSGKRNGNVDFLPDFWMYPFVAVCVIAFGWGMRTNPAACGLYFLGIAAALGIKLVMWVRQR